MNGQWTEALGYLAGVLTTFSLVPQVIRIWRLKTARDVSIEMFLLYSLGVLMWLAYGVLLHSWPMIVWNSVSFLLAAVIILLKVKYDRNAPHEIVHPLSKENQQ